MGGRGVAGKCIQHEHVEVLQIAALSNLSETPCNQLEDDADTEAKILEILMRAANDIKNT